MNETNATDLVTALFDRWYMSLVRYALRTTENYAVAEDLAQDTFMQLYQALRAGKTIEHPKAWTICVLRRTMSRQMKNHVPHESLDELEIAGQAQTDLSLLGDIRSLLSLLSPREEEVLLLRLEAFEISGNRRTTGDQHELRQHPAGARITQTPTSDSTTHKAREGEGKCRHTEHRSIPMRKHCSGIWMANCRTHGYGLFAIT